MNNQGPIGSEQRYTIYTDEPKTNGAGRTETMQLSAQEELIAGLITDSALSSVVAETGLNDSHFKRGTGLPGAFRFAMGGPQSVKQALYQASGSLTRSGFPNHLKNDSRWQTEGRLPWGEPLRYGRTIGAVTFGESRNG